MKHITIEKTVKTLKPKKPKLIECEHYFEIESSGGFIWSICRKCGERK